MSSHPALARFELLHRRLVLAAVLRGAAFGFACGAGLAVGIRLSIPLEARMATAIGLTAAGAASGFMRAPRRRAAARLLDARLGLEDRLVTALDVTPHQDGMSRALLDDTWLRLADVPPSSVANVRRLAGAAWLAIALVVIGLVARPVSPDAWRYTAAGPQPADGAVTEAVDAPGPDAATGGARAAQAARPGTRPQSRSTAAGSARTEAATSAARGSVSTPGGTGYLAPVPGAPGGGGAARGEAAGFEGRTTGDAAAARAEAGRTASVTGAAIAAGGSSGGTSPADPLARSPAGSVHPLVHRAEAALSRTPVPPGLRRYVMNYFLAITR